jgi:hypothetical protein
MKRVSVSVIALVVVALLVAASPAAAGTWAWTAMAGYSDAISANTATGSFAIRANGTYYFGGIFGLGGEFGHYRLGRGVYDFFNPNTMMDSMAEVSNTSWIGTAQVFARFDGKTFSPFLTAGGGFYSFWFNLREQDQVLGQASDTVQRRRLGLNIGAGTMVDFWPDTDWSLGIDFRYHNVPQGITNDDTGVDQSAFEFIDIVIGVGLK